VGDEKQQRYRVLTKLGAGGMGEVFPAEGCLPGSMVESRYFDWRWPMGLQ
jgi:hypothetical protein